MGKGAKPIATRFATRRGSRKELIQKGASSQKRRMADSSDEGSQKRRIFHESEESDQEPI